MDLTHFSDKIRLFYYDDRWRVGKYTIKKVCHIRDENKKKIDSSMRIHTLRHLKN